MKRRKLAIIIPCLNEAKSLPQVLNSIPKKIKGISKIETIVVDDGSTDQTAQVAKKSNVKHLVIHKKTQGLAKTFSDGLEKALNIKADIIVNIDGDNQYDANQIPKLIRPVLEKKADMVLGDRQIRQLKHMPGSKKFGNLFGSWVIRRLTGSTINDASTGFRAFSRETAESFNLTASHTYTHETVIHAHFKGFCLIEIPIRFRARKDGQSRLIQSVWNHIKTSGAIIVRTILIYKAFKYLTIIGSLVTFLGTLGGIRFLYFYFFTGEESGHVQSLILSSILINSGFTVTVIGILADLIGLNRKLIEKNEQSQR